MKSCMQSAPILVEYLAASEVIGSSSPERAVVFMNVHTHVHTHLSNSVWAHESSSTTQGKAEKLQLWKSRQLWTSTPRRMLEQALEWKSTCRKEIENFPCKT